MTRISSGFTFVFKGVFPVFWFGFLAIFLVVAALNASIEGAAIIMVAGVIVAAAIGFFAFKLAIWDHVDAVDDGGDFLLVRNRGEEERIPLSNIAAVKDWRGMNPPRITLTLRQPGKLGGKIVFMPKFWFGPPFARYPITQNLMERTANRATKP